MNKSTEWESLRTWENMRVKSCILLAAVSHDAPLELMMLSKSQKQDWKRAVKLKPWAERCCKFPNQTTGAHGYVSSTFVYYDLHGNHPFSTTYWIQMSQQSDPHLPLSSHLPRQPRNLIAVCPRASSPHTSPERHPEAIGSHDLLLESLFIPLKWGQVGKCICGLAAESSTWAANSWFCWFGAVWLMAEDILAVSQFLSVTNSMWKKPTDIVVLEFSPGRWRCGAAG